MTSHKRAAALLLKPSQKTRRPLRVSLVNKPQLVRFRKRNPSISVFVENQKRQKIATPDVSDPSRELRRYIEPTSRRLRYKQCEPLTYRILWTKAAEGHRFMLTKEGRLKDIKSGQIFKLLKRKTSFCMMPIPHERIKWRTKAGYQFMMMALTFSSSRYDFSDMTLNWWLKSIKGKASKLVATCYKCGHRSTKSCISNILKGQSFGCWCNNGVAWNTEMGWLRFQNLVHNRNPDCDISEMTLNWWLKSIKGKDSKLLATCRVCGYRNTRTCINNFVNNQSFGCQCTMGPQWNTEKGWLRLQTLVEERGLNYDISEMTIKWWLKSIEGANSKLVATCHICGQRCTNTSINELQRGGSFGCGCRNKTESLFAKEIEKQGAYPHQMHILYKAVERCRPMWATSARDFGVRLFCGIEVNEEVDGVQHFGSVLWGAGSTPSDPVKQAERDGCNARSALTAGVWVIRYYQPDMISERVDWRSYRRACHMYITEHVKKQSRVLVPKTAQSKYELWAVRANITVTFLWTDTSHCHV